VSPEGELKYHTSYGVDVLMAPQFVEYCPLADVLVVCESNFDRLDLRAHDDRVGLGLGHGVITILRRQA
jgi:hypothetical protein